MSVGMSAYIGPIPYPAVSGEGQRLGLVGDDFEHWLDCLIAMDRAYCEITNARMNQRAAKKKEGS